MAKEVDGDEQAAYRRLIEGIVNCAFAFVGAGVSRELGYPAWTTLLNRLHDACVAKGADAAFLDEVRQTGDYLYWANECHKIVRRQFILDEIVATYGPRTEKTSQLHQAIIKIAFDHFLTTNYDLGIESAHATAGLSARTLDIRDPEVSAFARAMSSHWGIERTVLHIHGRADQPATVVLALTDYNGVYILDAKANRAMKHLLYGKSFVFIGYSLGDPPFNTLLKEVAALSEENDRPQHWAFMSRPQNPDGNRGLLKANYNIEVIYYDLVDNRHDALVGLLLKIATDVAEMRSRSGSLVGPHVLDELFSDKKSVTREQIEQRLGISPQPLKPKDLAFVVAATSKADCKTPFDHRIDAQVELMKDGFFENARQKFEQLLLESPADAEPRLRFRLHANIGQCLLQLERFAEAVEQYEAAYQNTPENPDAMWMFALAAGLKGDRTEALSRAEKLCNAFPDNARGYSMRIRFAPDSTTILGLKRLTPRLIRRDADVAAALAEAANRREDWRASEAYARQSERAAPEWAYASTSVGSAIMNREMGGNLPDWDYRVVPLNRERLDEACRWFTKAINSLVKRPAIPHLAVAYINRASVKRLLGDDDGAFKDITDAYQVAPDDVEVVTKYAHALLGRGEPDQSIHLLESVPAATAYIPARFIRLMALERRKAKGDLELGVAEAKSLIELPQLDDILRADAHAILCTFYVAQDAHQKAINHLRKLDPSLLLPGLRDARLASFIYWYETKNSPEIVTLLTNAIAAARSISPWFARQEIAHICMRLGRYRDAADILATIISPCHYSEETKGYLECLLQSKQNAAVLEYCKELKRNSQYTAEVMHAECDALVFSGESKEAIELLADWLAWQPEDKIARLHQSVLFIARGESQRATFDPALLPSIGELRRPTDGIEIVRVLSHGPNFDIAMSYAHRLSQKYPENEQVLFAFIEAVMLRRGGEQVVPPKFVSVNHAVTLRLKNGDERRVVKVVDTKVEQPDEFHVQHEIAQAILGKQVGETVRFGKDDMIIESIVPIAALAAKEAIESFNLRFPHSKLIQKFHAPTPPPNPTSLREILGEEFWEIAEADDKATTNAFGLHQSGKVPLTMIARARGVTVFQIALHILSASDLEVLSVPEQPPLFASALEKVRSTRTVVLDATAVATLITFDMVHLLSEMPFDLIVPDSVLQEVRKAKYDAEQGSGSRRMGLKDGKFFMTETSPEEMKRWANSLQKLIDGIQNVAKVVGGLAREQVTFDRKDELLSALGESSFDAVAIASINNAVLWTDDRMLGQIANDLCGVSPIWTQALLHVADERTQKRWRGHYLSELLLYRFRGTFVIVADATQSLKRFKWRLDDPRLEGLRDHVKKHGGSPNNYDPMRSLFISMWKETPRKSRAKVTRVILSILEYLERESAKTHIARVLYKPTKLPLRLLLPACRRFRNIFRLWARQPSGKTRGRP